MSEVVYHVVAHDDGYAYRVDDVYSEPFPTHEEALEAARVAAAEHRLSGSDAEISYQDESGQWRSEHADGADRPVTDVEDDV
ncbi:DUF2188 domain-containing protein [Ciceribacter sp. L1K23]|uniref:DUF2188 domain-containing protein n=1 Tax=unclassified Ciceribacter TaxID=2628820 RepID=UPI001ABE742B|nr:MULTISPECIES: DUF2188 domain-containing protein [unclassified Ciceribacter]MBO3759121.1 DUF2188 domain-containing protein [Ciceribacter sp. L1K22]MBR0556732.1 DUF2188 domain-containing protein [Ciceribacter sp. L1K23]